MLTANGLNFNDDCFDSSHQEGPLWHQKSHDGWKVLVRYMPETTYFFFHQNWRYRIRISAETLADPDRFRVAVLNQALTYLSDRELDEFYAHGGTLQKLLAIARQELIEYPMKPGDGP